MVMSQMAPMALFEPYYYEVYNYTYIHIVMSSSQVGY
jgi:hypothetical protein